MGGTHDRRKRNPPGEPISVRGDVVIVRDPELGRRQAKAIGGFLLSLGTRVDGAGNSDTDVGAKGASGDGLEALMGPLEAEAVRVVWAAVAPVPVRRVMQALNERRPTPICYTTVQTVMARLARKAVLTRSRQSRADLFRAAAPDAPGLAVSRLLAQFGEAAIGPFVEHVCRDPKLRSMLRVAFYGTC